MMQDAEMPTCFALCEHNKMVAICAFQSPYTCPFWCIKLVTIQYKHGIGSAQTQLTCQTPAMNHALQYIPAAPVTLQPCPFFRLCPVLLNVVCSLCKPVDLQRTGQCMDELDRVWCCSIGNRCCDNGEGLGVDSDSTHLTNMSPITNKTKGT